MIEKACEMATARGLVDGPEDKIVMTAGMVRAAAARAVGDLSLLTRPRPPLSLSLQPFGAPGAANVIRVVPAAGPRCWDGQCTVE